MSSKESLCKLKKKTKKTVQRYIRALGNMRCVFFPLSEEPLTFFFFTQGPRSSLEEHMRGAAKSHDALDRQLVYTMTKEIESIKRLVQEQTVTLNELKHFTPGAISRLEKELREQSYYGTILWKVNLNHLNLSRKHRRSLVGPIFSSSKNGYKLQPSLRILSDNSTVSFAVQLMPGQFDSLLQWPFNLTVHYTILNQLDKTGFKDLVEKVNWDTLPAVFRVWFEMPDSSRTKGVAHQIPLQQLRSEGYMEDNTLVVHVSVTSELDQPAVSAR